jgi:hypothetical protein
MTDTKTPIKETSWMDEELTTLHSTSTPTGERLPALKLESGKITKFVVDFSAKFNTWTSSEGVVKAIIPVMHKTEKKNLWLNRSNPLYGQIVQRGAKGQTTFAVSTTGTQKETRYTIVDEE